MEKLIGKIVEIEHMAQKVTSDAKRRQAGFDADVSGEAERLKKEFFDRAKRRIEIIEQSEKEHLQLGVQKLEEEYEASSERLERQKQENLGRWADEIMQELLSLE